MTIDRGLFVFLLAIDVVRTLRHAIWRDELQIFMIAASSATPAQLFYNLKYEPHPALWYTRKMRRRAGHQRLAADFNSPPLCT